MKTSSWKLETVIVRNLKIDIALCCRFEEVSHERLKNTAPLRETQFIAPEEKVENCFACAKKHLRIFMPVRPAMVEFCTFSYSLVTWRWAKVLVTPEMRSLLEYSCKMSAIISNHSVRSSKSISRRAFAHSITPTIKFCDAEMTCMVEMFRRN